MSIARVSCVVALLAVLPGAASAAGRGSAEDQIACTPDVYRLCAGEIPDEDAIVNCLKAHKASLSPACGKVFSGPPSPNDVAVPQDDE